jgi:hypothetical protein
MLNSASSFVFLDFFVLLLLISIKLWPELDWDDKNCRIMFNCILVACIGTKVMQNSF